MSIESRFDVPFIAALALREKRIQQNYRPIIAVHKWFARRPGTLFRGLALAEFGDEPIADTFFRANNFADHKVADPFMGGGTPLLEANRLGCDVQGVDINPMSAWIVREELEHLNVARYDEAARHLRNALKAKIGCYYRTNCPIYGDTDVPVKYFLWVKTLECESCGENFDLFPGYLLAEDKRHPKNILVCPACGDLNEVNDRQQPGSCHTCNNLLRQKGPARRNRCGCPSCGHINAFPRIRSGPLRHRLFAIEYYNPIRNARHKGRFFKKPDADDLALVQAAAQRWKSLNAKFVPTEHILPGDETDRLHRWGYHSYHEMFNPRQRLGLELSCHLIAQTENQRIRYALATNLSDLLRYQNMLCRYDTMALKSLDIFSIHGFPVGLVQCESNLLGIINGKGINVGSGGWSNIISKYAKAKRYCTEPFEVRRDGSRNVKVSIKGEWIGEKRNAGEHRKISIQCRSATSVQIPPKSLDAVFTDPPYFGNIQYGELMDFCYVWLRRLVDKGTDGFDRESARSPDELTRNVTEDRGIEHFTEGLAAVYTHMAEALKTGAPLVFTYHHNKFEAYYPVGVAILDAGLTCSASLPCPAEMGGSIHIHGTSSSIVDTVFVCRSIGSTRRRWLFATNERLAEIVANDLSQLEEAGMKPTQGDTRCIIFGHITRMTIWNLRQTWNVEQSPKKKLQLFREIASALGDTKQVMALLNSPSAKHKCIYPHAPTTQSNSEIRDAVSF